jgi:broad specificity phosphatase PhoE
LTADFVIPGGESRAQHLERVVSWLREVSEGHRNVLAVTHGGTIDFLFRLGTGRPLHGGDQVFAGPPAALSVFAVSWPTVEVLMHGRPLAGSVGP